MAAVRDTAGKGERGAEPAERRYGRLSPGPGVPRDRVAANQRARLQRAMIEIVGEQGHDAVTVRGLTRLAGVSTRTFYEHFEGKDDCLLSTYEAVIEQVASQLRPSRFPGLGWKRRLEEAMRALTVEAAHQPKAARLVLVETFAVGPEALERMRSVGEALEGVIQESGPRTPAGEKLPPLVAKGIAAGVARAVGARLLAERARELPDIAPDLARWVACVGDEAWATLCPLDLRAALAVQRAAGPERREPWTAREAFGDERALILAATRRLAEGDGYGSLTAPAIRSVAGVSRRSLDRHFEDVSDCFLAALEVLIGRALLSAVRRGAVAETWAGRVHRSLLSFCTSVARDPALAKLGFVEIFAPGTPGVQLRARLTAAVTEGFRETAPASKRPGELDAECSVGAIWGVIHHHVMVGTTAELPRSAATLSFLALAPALGPAAAAEAIQAEQRRIDAEAVTLSLSS